MSLATATIRKLQTRWPLSGEEARVLFDQIMSGMVSEEEIISILRRLSHTDQASSVIAGAAKAMRAKARALPIPHWIPAVDTCGTGGDVKGTFNISTAAAIIAAAAGAPVVKHGNRAATSKSGSADALEKLGVNVEADTGTLLRCLNACRICFAYARTHHPAMQYVVRARAAIPHPTIFNLLGPLTNPARTKYQVLGVFDGKLTNVIASALKRLGSVRSWVVHAEDGLDELSTMSPTQVTELIQGRVCRWVLDPKSLGIDRSRLEDLQVDGSDQSAAVIRRIVNKQKWPPRDIAVLNAAAALVICGKCSNLWEAKNLAEEAIDTGEASRVLDLLIRITQPPTRINDISFSRSGIYRMTPSECGWHGIAAGSQFL